MSPAEMAAMDRHLAARRELAVATSMLGVEAHDAAGAMRDLSAALQASDLRLALDEADKIASHPDLGALDVAMDGWYGA